MRKLEMYDQDHAERVRLNLATSDHLKSLRYTTPSGSIAGFDGSAEKGWEYWSLMASSSLLRIVEMKSGYEVADQIFEFFIPAANKVKDCSEQIESLILKHFSD